MGIWRPRGKVLRSRPALTRGETPEISREAMSTANPTWPKSVDQFDVSSGGGFGGIYAANALHLTRPS